MQRKFTLSHKFKKDSFPWGIHINKKPPAAWNIHLSLQHWILCRAYSCLESQNRFILDHSRLNRMNSTRSTCVNIVSSKSGNMGVWEDEAARATLPSMLILGVTGVIFTESFGIDGSILDKMNNTRSTCVIIKSNLVTCLGGSARSQRTDSTTVTPY
ncbi:hypothetical protein T07_6249 [Trichinella nelsoni]|uniref:Uncharacterized protein n=1 Tax=Trichinella nelsoni TaxID=6336 RepID=A0A0V0RD21_9BILA|nr:hypothetical protein T07_6249 [Trichinella nelsoni]